MDIDERANGLRGEMDRCLAFGLGEWESDPLGPEDLPHAGEVARLAGCELAERDGEMVYRRSWGREESDALDRRLVEAGRDDDEAAGLRRSCAVHRVYLDLAVRGKGLDELPEWAWATLTDEGFRPRALYDLGDPTVPATSLRYYEELFYVYRDVEACLSGLGRSEWFDADFAYWHQT